jgi:uncharacterized protein YecT (DUF1311 family)
MKKFLIMAGLALGCFAHAEAQPAWLPPHSSIPSDTISPDGHYGVLMPDSETDGSNTLVDMKTGKLVADLAGVPGWREAGHSMRCGEMEARWSADSTALCWIHPDKWFQVSYVVLKLENGKLAWQVELMKQADREILSRTEAATPLNFAIAKLENADDGNSYPEGFSIGVSEPDKFSLPLVCTVTLTNNSKGSEDEPEENGVRAWLTMTVSDDGSLSYADFKVKQGHLSQDAAERIKAHTVSVSLVDTDLGKAMLFPDLSSKDGRYAVGWTIQAATKEKPPVDWSHWDSADPDKLLRLYDWQRYGYEDKVKLPYDAFNFVWDTRTGKTAGLPTELPNWPGKRDGWEMIAKWYSGTDGRRYGLIENGQQGVFGSANNFWLVNLSEKQMEVKDLTTTMRKAVNDLLHERRPEVAASDFLVSYSLKAGEKAVKKEGLVEVPFVANAPSSDQGEFQLSGAVTIRLSDSTVVSATSGEKRLEPFVTNEALRLADETLNTTFQAVIKSMPPSDAQAFKQEERDWISKRDADASQAVNITSFGSTQQTYEEARENSLLKSTEKRIEELKHRIPKG